MKLDIVIAGIAKKDFSNSMFPKPKKSKKIKALTLGSFQRKSVQDSFGHYFSHILPDGKEVCLESCLSGYCVGIYDREGGELIGEKTCTRIEGMLESQIASGFSILSGEALQKAIQIANQKINLLEKEKV